MTEGTWGGPDRCAVSDTRRADSAVNGGRLQRLISYFWGGSTTRGRLPEAFGLMKKLQESFGKRKKSLLLGYAARGPLPCLDVLVSSDHSAPLFVRTYALNLCPYALSTLAHSSISVPSQAPFLCNTSNMLIAMLIIKMSHKRLMG